MNIITGSIKDTISIKMKHRHDDFTDQFSRIFMAKMFIISSLIMSVDFFSDKVSCIVPIDSRLSREFIHSCCWIQGFYIYEELKDRMTESGYYGIPKDIELDGTNAQGKLCTRVNKASHLLDHDCTPMSKLFYLQFQYFPFYIASLAILYYMPYILFRIVNDDLISLKGNLCNPESQANVDAEKIVENYFNYRMNGGRRILQIKNVSNLGIKSAYVFVNVIAFIATNNLLNGDYYSYGLDWFDWSRLNNTQAFAYYESRQKPKPGNHLLPPMGFCEIFEGSKDIRTTFVNENKFICEISPNVLYQYVLVVLWYLFIISIIVSIIGLLLYILFHIQNYIRCFQICRSPKNEFDIVARDLTLRELEYLRFMRKKNLNAYGDVIRMLHQQRMKDSYNYELRDDSSTKNVSLLNANML